MTEHDDSKKQTVQRPPSPPPVRDSSEPQRRVYALPQEMVDRIVEFQKEKGLPSEVEAARRLIDEALKRRDNWMKIALRFQAKFKETNFLSDAAREVLMGHPLVTNISITESRIVFDLSTGEQLNAVDSGEIFIKDRHGTQTYIDSDGVHHQTPF